MRGVKLLESGRYQARYFAGYRANGERIYPSRTFETEGAALAWYWARLEDREPQPRVRQPFPDGWLKRSYGSIRSSAKFRKLPFNLSIEEYARMIEDADGRCTLTGIPFDFRLMDGRHKRRPFAPSLDRIDSAQGYSVANCRVVCCAVNVALGEWGMKCLMRIARNLVIRERDIMAKEGLRTSVTETPCTPLAHQNAQNGQKAQEI